MQYLRHAIDIARDVAWVLCCVATGVPPKCAVLA
jgi:hypothetical protein